MYYEKKILFYSKQGTLAIVQKLEFSVYLFPN